MVAVQIDAVELGCPVRKSGSVEVTLESFVLASTFISEPTSGESYYLEGTNRYYQI